MYMYNSKKKILHATSIVEKKNLVTFQIVYIRVNMTFSTVTITIPHKLYKYKNKTPLKLDNEMNS